MSFRDDYLELVNKLRDIDPEFNIFGSTGHWYEIKEPVQELSIPLALAEQFWDIVFPEEYKYYMLNISNGGPGPFYGLLSLEKMFEENDYEFHITENDEKYIVIESQGCVFRSALILDGPNAGRVYSMYSENGKWASSDDFGPFNEYIMNGLNKRYNQATNHHKE